jgi:hypothetical protein
MGIDGKGRRQRERGDADVDLAEHEEVPRMGCRKEAGVARLCTLHNGFVTI